jgi:hypothetical protein
MHSMRALPPRGRATHAWRHSADDATVPAASVTEKSGEALCSSSVAVARSASRQSVRPSRHSVSSVVAVVNVVLVPPPMSAAAAANEISSATQTAAADTCMMRRMLRD